MKVILLKDVPGTGAAGEVKEVKDGHARNYLIPRGLAMPASEGAVRSLAGRKQAEQRRLERQRSETDELVARLKGLVLEVRGRAGEGGRLFGSVTPQQVAEALAARGFAITRKQIELEEPIRVEGFYQVPVRVAPGVVVHVDLNVIATR
ncbi:MAG: 50S ribosomal protein L9 [Armatimonadota bacterium]|nr:50S ribosomal protein L9 [Armatimonadota bacterium]MDR7423539.1 50S ribosomal protein L9 [Armatimonadota bacterium]MDR7457439.1 50S ribosomal protein L9 [Armatimonadota bacterium]MDR7496570.1 50S ribosomal protein L9 [Armatimonadota bacterium]MDR7511777.1 50S ribosomal protein L9 [Armatimonadota bacterium]